MLKQLCNHWKFKVYNLKFSSVIQFCHTNFQIKIPMGLFCNILYNCLLQFRKIYADSKIFSFGQNVIFSLYQKRYVSKIVVILAIKAGNEGNMYKLYINMSFKALMASMPTFFLPFNSSLYTIVLALTLKNKFSKIYTGAGILWPLGENLRRFATY